MPITVGEFGPVNEVTPFTYRDNATYLTILRTHTEKINEIITALETLDSTTAKRLSDTFRDLVTQMNKAFADEKDYINQRIAETYTRHELTFEPTRGQEMVSVEVALMRMYDYLRPYALFAFEADALEMSAKDYDALGLPARVHDLMRDYPTLHYYQGDMH